MRWGHLQLVATSEGRGRQLTARRHDLDGGEVHVVVLPLDDPFEDAPVRQRDGHLRRESRRR